MLLRLAKASADANQTRRFLALANFFWLSDEQFHRVVPSVSNKTRGVLRIDDQRVIIGVVHVLKSGGRWVVAPPVCGPRKIRYNHFVRWAEKSIWMDVFHTLAFAGGPPAEVLTDTSTVKSYRSAAGEKGGSAARPSGDREAVEPPRPMPLSLIFLRSALLTGGNVAN
jgi:transposase